jgi:mono/diheme cytochrome c family protein
MKTLKKVFFSSLVALVSVSLLNLNLSGQTQPKPWDVPANFKTMKNPVAQGDVSTKAGLALYTKNCASCHGKTGLGDGVKARMLKDFPGDFSGTFFQNQTDGEHFYKTKTGRGEMPKYEGKISDDEIWNIVNYMRKFKK